MHVPSLGRRGEGWVALQIVALALVLVSGWAGPAWPASWTAALRLAGAVLVVGGVVLAVAATRSLGSSLTALPRPAPSASLREDGVYARARHPIYGALLLVALGFAALTSWWAVVAWGFLLGVLLAKSAREEVWLAERYPGYPAYRARVTRRFVPFVG